MKHSIKLPTLTVVPFAISLLTAAAQDAGEYRAWTNNKGRVIQAALIESNPVSVSLRMKNGREYQVKILELSDGDVAYIKKWEEEKTRLEKLAAQPKPLTETLMTKAGQLIYSDGLSDIQDGWMHKLGDWKNEEGALIGAEKPSDDHGAVFKRKLSFTNVIIEFSFKLDGASGISLSIDDDEDHVCRMNINPAGFTVQKDDHDHEGPDERVEFEHLNTEIEPNEWHVARIEILGNEMLGQIGEAIGFGTHQLIGTEKTRFGFTVAGQSAQFKELKVWESLPNETWEKEKRRLERKRK